MNKKELKLWLFLIILIAAFLRLFVLNLWPMALSSNEALLGYRAFSIASTGRDEFARLLPIIFSSSMDYQLPVTTYILTPFVKLLGLNELSIRLPVAIIGVAIIPLIYLLVKKLFANEKIALWAAFFTAISPWGVFLSRFVSPEIIALFFFLCGFYFSLNNRWQTKILTIIFFTLTLYTVKIAWFFLPPFLLIWLFWSQRQKIIQLKSGLLILSLIFILWLPLLATYTHLSDFRRSLLLNDFSLFTDIGLTNWANVLRGEDNSKGVVLLGKIFHNRPVIYATEISSRTLKHFTPRFLFAAGDENPSHGLSQQGPFLLVSVAFLISGLLRLGKTKNHQNLLLFLWFLLATIPSVFVLKSPDVSRFIFAFPVISIILGVGAANLQKKPLIYFLSALIIFNGFVAWYDAQVKEPNRNYLAWSVGYKQAFNETEKHKISYNKVYVSNSYGTNQSALALFYLAYPPEKLWQDYPVKSLGFRPWIRHFDKYGFGQLSQTILDPKNKSLYLGAPSDFINIGNYQDFGTIYAGGKPVLSLIFFPDKKEIQ